ncbi:MAG: hypothetical protein KAQ67_07580 [Gammaproteobacteria bacterium]|nr:hypothetical protein [Gammaproteobacteria bacterium]
MLIETLKHYMGLILALVALIFFVGLIVWGLPKKAIVEHKEVGYEAADIKVKRDDK